MERKELGKIESVSFGFWEYAFGLHIVLTGNWGGVSTSISYNPTYKDEQIKNQCGIEIMEKVQKLLNDAKVERVEELKNKPIEVTFGGNVLKEFRILTEVL